MTIYCGVDFHARLQTVSFMDTADGEDRQRDLHHQEDDIRAFYSQFAGEVIVGWLRPADLATATGLAKVLSLAELILGLLRKAESPRIHHLSFESREVLRLLRYRHRLA